MFPSTTSGQSLKESCGENLDARSNAVEQKQWGLLVSKAREFMSNCLTVDGGAEAEAIALFEMGFGLKKQGKFADAVPIWKRCVKIKPDDAACWSYLAEALDEQGEFEDVVPTLKRCVSIKPDAAGCWVDLGIALDRAGRRSEAKKAYEQAISIGGYTEENAAAVELARDGLSHPQTAATFRGHRLGESWQSFIRTEEGLCKIKLNTERCSEAASGAEATLSQYTKDGTVMFNFEYGRFAGVVASMTGPAFAALTYFEKTYGEPYDKHSHPEEGTAESSWHFSDGGDAHATESKAKSDEFTIIFTIKASDDVLRSGVPAANPQTPVLNGHTLGESWQKFAQTGGVLCLSEDNAQACKKAASGESAVLGKRSEDGFVEAFFAFKLGRLTQADLNTRVPKFVELNYLDQTYGHPYRGTNSPEIGAADRRWDYADGGQVSASEMPYAQDFIITISAKTIPPH
jgi:tetratricopeptide (TPR) repeat protein